MRASFVKTHGIVIDAPAIEQRTSESHALTIHLALGIYFHQQGLNEVRENLRTHN